MQAAEMRFLWRMSGLNLRDGVRSSDVWRELGVDRCILALKLSRFRHLFRMPYQTRHTGPKSQARPRTHLGGLHALAGLGAPRGPQEELKGVADVKEAWNTALSLLQPQPNPTDGWLSHLSLFFPHAFL